MTNTPNPTWYDILGVERDATPEQIKAAWRVATDKFEPGSGTSQFRLFNEAADVLLDPDRRAAYDADLGEDSPTAEAPTAATLAPETAVLEPAEGADAAPADAAPADADPADADPADADPDTTIDGGTGPEQGQSEQGQPEQGQPEQGQPEPEPAEADPAEPTPAGAAADAGGILGRLGAHLGWVMVVCVPVLVASIVVALVAVFGLHLWKADVEGLVPTARTFDAGPDASAAAEGALKAVLSYDYRHMEADRDRAVQYLTPSYKKDYLKTFNDLLEKGPDGSPGPVEKTQAVVTADVLDTGIVDADSNRVRVIVFVNQSSTKGDAEPTVFQNRVVATMVHRGDRWLVDNLTSY